MGLDSLLIERGLLSKADAQRALDEQRSSGERLDRVLIRLALLDRPAVLAAMSEQLRMPVIDLSEVTPAEGVLQALPSKLVYRLRCVPIAREGNRLTIATADPFDSSAIDEVRLAAGGPVDLVLADEQELHSFIRAHFGVGGDTLEGLDAAAGDSPAAAGPADEIEQAQEASVVRLVHDLLVEAVNERATDVHIEPYEHQLVVRYRIDGVLQRANVPPTISRFGAAIVSRLKIMANLNIAEKRRPQDGRITFRARLPGAPATSEFDLRVSVIPMLIGEGVVLRVLNKSAVMYHLPDLGMPPEVAARWDRLISLPHGILLVTGPTGSGKSTTLYASLNRIVSDEVKVITIEDPVEYHVAGVNQIQVNPKVDLTFAAGLRAVLRHDPDVVMIGEIRDRETAETAIQASLTGHLVFSTLHTNDAAGATTRLLDMGVEPFLVSSSVEGILAQRLVRRICPQCAADHSPEPGEVPDDFDLAPGATIRRGAGCRACRQTGYRGRVGVYELLELDEELRDRVMHREAGPKIAAAAARAGKLFTLRADGFAKVRAGVTTLAEVIRAINA